MLAVQGPRAREIVQAISDAPLPARMTRRDPQSAGRRRCSSAAPATPARTASSCSAHRSDAPALWDELVASRRHARRAGRARHAAPGGLLSPLRQRPVESSAGRSKPAWAGAVDEDTGFIGSDAVRAVRAAGPREKLVAFAIDGPGIARQGNPIVGRRRGDERHALAEPGDRHRHGLRARRRRPPWAPASRSTFVARCARAVVRRSRSTERAREWPRPATPTICSTTPSTTGRASSADGRRAPEATLGITWYAQDALGEVVFFDPPDRRDDARARTRPTPRSSRSRPSRT